MQRFSVLIIEPTSVLAQLLERLVEHVGGSSRVATSGTEATHWLREESFDVVCSAAVLPDTSAVELAQVVRSDYPTLPFVVLLATPDEVFCHRALSAGATQVFARTQISTLATYLEIAAKRVHEAHLSGRVMLVEDSPSIVRLLTAHLTQAGLEVEVFRTAELAMQRFVSGSFDIVVTDIVLPGAHNGVALVRELRNGYGELGARVPILAVTSLDDTARRLELLRSGVSDMMLKPILGEELIARVRNLLRSKRLLEQVEEQQAQLRNLALTDQLTQLHNRHFLLEAAAQALAEAHLNRQPLGLLVLDIDHFKSINDTHGHRSGDEVLAAVAVILKRKSRGEDIVARFGGEEFVIMLPQCSADGAMSRAEVLRAAIEKACPGGLPVTVSIGVASSASGDMPTFDQLFNRADQALYQAKSTGRNRVVLAQPSTVTDA